ncbi:MAG: phage baseplate assembly protein [Pseudomonadota bacterium]
MVNNPERIGISLGGEPYGGFTDVDVEAKMDEAPRTFTISTTERPGEFKFPPGTPCTITANGDPVLTGFTNRYQPKGNATTHTISIAGRGKAQDFVDSAAIIPGMHLLKSTPGDLAVALDNWGLGMRDEVGLSPVPVQHIATGEKGYEAVERYLRPQGAVMMEQGDGQVVITNASVAKRHAGSLHESIFVDYSGEISDDRQYSEYNVAGQSRAGWDSAALQVWETVANTAVGRYRPFIGWFEGDVDAGRARARAQNEQVRAAGFSISCQIMVQGWRDHDGTLWQPNWQIYIDSPILLHIEQDMLIEGVQYHQSNSGSFATLSLVDPRAHGGKPGRSQSDKAWGANYQ